MSSKKHDPLRAAGTFDDLDISLSDAATQVVPGEYLAQVIGCRRQWRFGRELLAFQFRLVGSGPFVGAVLPGYCGLNDAGPRLRTLSPRSKLSSWLRALRALDPSIPSARIPLCAFAGHTFLVRVVSPQRDYKRRPVALADRKPKVEEIVRAVEKVEMPKKEKKRILSSSLSGSSHLCKVEDIDKMKEI